MLLSTPNKCKKACGILGEIFDGIFERINKILKAGRLRGPGGVRGMFRYEVK
jgi:hypothetical protein